MSTGAAPAQMEPVSGVADSMPLATPRSDLIAQLLLDWPDERAPRADCLDNALLKRQREDLVELCDDDVLEVLQRCMCRIIPRGQRTLEDCWGALVWWAVDGDGDGKVGGQRRRRVGHFCARDRVAPNGDACCAECMLARRLAPPCDGG
jgi:hypothetical protein